MTVENKDQLTKEIVEQSLTDFIKTLNEFKGRASVLSQKSMSRAMRYAMVDGLVDIDVNIRGQQELEMVKCIDKLMRLRTILFAGMMKFNNKKEEQTNQLEMSIKEE